LDGCPDNLSNADGLRRDLQCVVKYWVCFASPYTIRERQLSKARYINELPHSIEQIEHVTYVAATTATANDRNAIFIDTTKGLRVYNHKQWLSYWLELCFMARERDSRNYQDIELRSTRLIGYTQSYKTWERLNSIYDFSNKSVIEYGCHYGYFLFKAEDAGASNLFGIDFNPVAIQKAHDIAVLRSSRARFLLADIKDYEPKYHFHVAFVLNTLHHLNDDHDVWNRIFTYADDILVEVPIRSLEVIEEVAQKHAFYKIVQLNSHRYDRIVVRYSAENAIPRLTPQRYHYTRYSYLRQQSHKRLMVALGNAGRALRKTGLYPWPRGAP